MYEDYRFTVPCFHIPNVSGIDRTPKIVVRLRAGNDCEYMALMSRQMLEDFWRVKGQVFYKANVITEVDNQTFDYLKETLFPSPHIPSLYVLDLNEMEFLINVLNSEWAQKLIVEEQPVEEIAEKQISNVESQPRELRYPNYSGFVYLLKMVNGNYWKIGRTNNPENRLKIFHVKLPFAVEFEHLIKTENMQKLERELHLQYQEKRIRGEWFALSAQDIAAIKAL